MSTLGNVLVTARMFGRESREPYDVLERAGCRLLPNPHAGRTLEQHELLGLIAAADAVVLGNEALDVAVLEAAPRLRVVSRFGVGTNNIDVRAATDRGVVVTNTPGANSDTVADLTMGLIIGLARQIPHADRAVKAGQFPAVKGVELRNKVLGLLGLGRIGRAVARRASAFGMRVLGSDPAVEPTGAPDGGIELVPAKQLVAAADFLSVHAPLTDTTYRMVDTQFLQAMKAGAYVINAARGGIVDEKALTAMLDDGHIAGAALDVFEEEPPDPAQPLLHHPHVITTPHMGGFTAEAIDQSGLIAADNVVAVLRNARPPHPLNPEVLDG